MFISSCPLHIVRSLLDSLFARTHSSLIVTDGSFSPRPTLGLRNLMFFFCRICQSVTKLQAWVLLSYQSQAEMYRRRADLNMIPRLLSLDQCENILCHNLSLSKTGTRSLVGSGIGNVADSE